VEKLVHVIWGADAPDDELRDQLLHDVAPHLLALGGVHALTVDVHDSHAAQAPSPVPTPAGELLHTAIVSTWVDAYDRRAAPIADVLATLDRTVAGYLVTESLYDDYGTTPHAPPRSWPDGEPSPGVLTVALIHRPSTLPYDEWIARWHGTQSPVSAELQPRTRYVRNEVRRPITAGAPVIDGIVEEAWPSVEHVRDPMLFFNARSNDELQANVARMMDSVAACLDLDRLRSATMTEHFVRSLPGGSPLP
jgi:hypothetical protein